MDIVTIGIGSSQAFEKSKEIDGNFFDKMNTEETGGVLKDISIATIGVLSAPLGAGISVVDLYTSTPDGQEAIKRGQELRRKKEEGNTFPSYNLLI